jgi:hypothetical protein
LIIADRNPFSANTLHVSDIPQPTTDNSNVGMSAAAAAKGKLWYLPNSYF